MAVAIPSPHVSFASGSSYLLNALVPMPLHFLFLSPASSLYSSLFHLFLGALCAPVWVFRLSAFHSPPPEASLLRTPTASFSHCHLPQWCSSQIAHEPSPVDHSVFYFMFSLVSLYFVSFDFSLYFVLLDFLVFALVFPCIALFCLFCVFFYFYNFIDLLRVCFSVLHPLLGLFSCPHRAELLMRPSV
jgi:hypothetical protein